MYYDFGDFLNTVKYLDKPDALSTTYAKHAALDKVSALDKKEGARALQEKISALLLWMETSQKPEALNSDDLAKLKPMCENLVSKKQMDPKALSIFEKS